MLGSGLRVEMKEVEIEDEKELLKMEWEEGFYVFFGNKKQFLGFFGKWNENCVCVCLCVIFGGSFGGWFWN